MKPRVLAVLGVAMVAAAAVLIGFGLVAGHVWWVPGMPLCCSAVWAAR